LPVVGRHHPAAPAEEVFHPRQPVFAEHELDARRLGRDLLGEVVHGGAEATIDDHGVGALARLLERVKQALAVVTHRRLPLDGKRDMSSAEKRLGVTWSSPPRSTIDGTVIGGRVASRRSISSKRGSLGALPWRTRYEWITTSTKSGLSNDGAVRSNVASSNF